MDERFLPFVRTDKFGDKGEQPQSLLTQIWLVVAAFTLLPIKLLGAFSCLLSFYLVCRVASLLPVAARSKIVPELGKIHCRACLFCLGFVRIRWHKLDTSSSDCPKAAGIVSNHLGWADILIHMSRSFPSFVARDGTQKLPFVGFISQQMDCIYVEREGKTGAPRGGVSKLAKERIEHVATNRTPSFRPMLLFPEGTTSNGHYLLPFKTGAFLAGQPLQPVIIEYTPTMVSPCWESITAKRHLFLVLTHLFFFVDCYELPVYAPSEAEKKDPVLYASSLRQYMLEHSRLKPTEATLEDKRRYHRILRGEEQGPAAHGDARTPGDKNK